MRWTQWGQEGSPGAKVISMPGLATCTVPSLAIGTTGRQFLPFPSRHLSTQEPEPWQWCLRLLREVKMSYSQPRSLRRIRRGAQA